MEKKKDKRRRLKAIGSLGGLKGGPARAAALTPERRKEIASDAAKARWKKRKKAQRVRLGK